MGPDVVTGIYSFVLCSVIYFILMLVFMIGTFLVNSLSPLMLFDSSVSWSFVSQSFGRDVDMNLGQLDCPLRVPIANEHRVSALVVFRNCTLEILRVYYLIDLILVPIGGYIHGCRDGLVGQVWSHDRL